MPLSISVAAVRDAGSNVCLANGGRWAGSHRRNAGACLEWRGVAIAVFSALVDVKADPDEVRGSIPATAVAMSEFLRRSRLELPSP
jgi:hypothetical protein